MSSTIAALSSSHTFAMSSSSVDAGSVPASETAVAKYRQRGDGSDLKADASAVSASVSTSPKTMADAFLSHPRRSAQRRQAHTRTPRRRADDPGLLERRRGSIDTTGERALVVEARAAASLRACFIRCNNCSNCNSVIPMPGGPEGGLLQVRAISHPLRNPRAFVLLLERADEAAAGGPVLFHGMWTQDARLKEVFRVIERRRLRRLGSAASPCGGACASWGFCA